MERTGSDSTTGGVEGAVLDGGPGVIAKEGLGLVESEDTVMTDRCKSRVQLAATKLPPDAYRPALNGLLSGRIFSRLHQLSYQIVTHNLKLALG